MSWVISVLAERGRLVADDADGTLTLVGWLSATPLALRRYQEVANSLGLFPAVASVPMLTPTASGQVRL